MWTGIEFKRSLGSPSLTFRVPKFSQCIWRFPALPLSPGRGWARQPEPRMVPCGLPPPLARGTVCLPPAHPAASTQGPTQLYRGVLPDAPWLLKQASRYDICAAGHAIGSCSRCSQHVGCANGCLNKDICDFLLKRATWGNVWRLWKSFPIYLVNYLHFSCILCKEAKI